MALKYNSVQRRCRNEVETALKRESHMATMQLNWV